MSAPAYDELELRLLLVQACTAIGSKAAFERVHRLPQGYVAKVVIGARPPTPKILEILGFAKVTRYVREPAIVSGDPPRNAVGLVP